VSHYDKPWTPKAKKFLANTVCVEPDHEAHPVGECPGIPAEKIDDSEFPQRPRSQLESPPD
jgi:hypothetical protein